jgi:hypothetical protein
MMLTGLEVSLKPVPKQLHLPYQVDSVPLHHLAILMLARIPRSKQVVYHEICSVLVSMIATTILSSRSEISVKRPKVLGNHLFSKLESAKVMERNM